MKATMILAFIVASSSTAQALSIPSTKMPDSLSFKDKMKTTIMASSPHTDEEAIYDEEGTDESEGMDEETSEIYGLETILCSNEDEIKIRSEDLTTVLYSAKNGDDIKVFQGWGESNKTIDVAGKKLTFIKINFLDADGAAQVGYVLQSLVKAKNNCHYLPMEEEPTEIILKDSVIKGIDDENCCAFPTKENVRASFTEGMRRFGANRSGGSRVHAAVDLYRFINEPILSVAPGKVIRNLYYFYQGTYALEVVHSGGFVVRYGEITAKTPKGIKKDKQLAMGEQLGLMGKVSGANVEPMLHFELYRGTLQGPLTQNGLGGPDNRRYNRRDDLMNPTPYMLKWQAKNF